MHANRLLRSEQRAHELVLYDFLARLYESQLARTSATSLSLPAARKISSARGGFGLRDSASKK